MSSNGKIDAYLDCNSPYSYFAFLWLRKSRQALAEHGVEVELHPVFLGGINVGSGNKPPWTLEAKAQYSKFDRPRAEKYFGLTTSWQAPSFFPILTLLPLRCMLYIRTHFPTPRYEDQFGSLWEAYWQDHQDISKPEIMTQCLRRHFTASEAERIMSAGTSAEYKKLLTEETEKLVKEGGAFGAPWFLVRDKRGKVEPFFGSDRFHYMLQYLEIPFSDITIQPKL